MKNMDSITSLTFHKVAVTEKYLPATIEVLSSPFMVIKHGAVYKFNRAKGIEEEVYPEGFVVYYNKKGNSDNEFFYLLDILSNYQILDGINKIRIRLAYREKVRGFSPIFNGELKNMRMSMG